jgi:hypothetical protein
MLHGENVDLALDLYLDQRPRGRFGAFARGVWYGGSTATNVTGQFGANGGDDVFTAAFAWPGPDDEVWHWSVQGRRAVPGTGFAVQVDGFGRSSYVQGMLTATQTAGPTR